MRQPKKIKNTETLLPNDMSSGRCSKHRGLNSHGRDQCLLLYEEKHKEKTLWDTGRSMATVWDTGRSMATGQVFVKVLQKSQSLRQLFQHYVHPYFVLKLSSAQMHR